MTQQPFSPEEINSLSREMDTQLLALHNAAAESELAGTQPLNRQRAGRSVIFPDCAAHFSQSGKITLRHRSS